MSAGTARQPDPGQLEGQPDEVRLPAPGRYRVREPVTVEAILWTGQNEEAVRSFTGWGLISLPPGCYVVKGITGHFFTVGADRFAATYEPAGGTAGADAGRIEEAARVLERRYPGTRPEVLDDLLGELKAIARSWRRLEGEEGR